MEDIQDNEILTRSLDIKDKKIIRELFRDARLPFSTIGKNVRLSKESVNYRVGRLMDIGLITAFNTIIDVKKLNWQMYMVYIRLRNIDLKKEDEIITRLKNHPNVAQLLKTIGNYDIVMKLFVRDHLHMDSIMKEFEEDFQLHMDEHNVDFLVEEHAVPFSFLYQPKKKDELFILKEKTKFVELTDVDLKILRILSNNARIQISELSEKLKLSRDLIKYRLKRMEREEVILNYRPDVWPKKLGYNWYFVSLKLGKLSKDINNKFTTFLLNHPNVTYFYKTIGTSEMHIEFRIKSRIELNKVLMKIREILKTVLKRHELLMILYEYKYTYFPDCLLGNNKK